MKEKKINLKKILLITSVALFIVTILFTGLMHYALTSFFKRGDYPDYPSAYYNYSQYQGDYPREEVSFYSGKNLLKGFLYGEKDANRLLILCHGLGTGHEAYINEIVYMVDAGYLVFAYDSTGSGYSEGESTVGLLQSALDLDAAFDYVNSSSDLKDLPIYLMGHSWGGFAVSEAIGRHEDIVAVVALAPYAKPVDLLIEQGSQMFDIDLKAMKPFLYLSQLITYGSDNFMRNAVDSINSADTPILLVHGTKDEMIPLETTAVLAYEGALKNPKLQKLIISEEGQNTHNSILHSAESNAYIEEINKDFAAKVSSIGEVSDEDRLERILQFRKELVESADLPLVNQINEDLFAYILNFYDEASR